MDEVKNIYEEHNVVEFDCWNNLSNVWFGGISNQLTRNISMIMKYKLDGIDPLLRVPTSM